MFSRLLTGKGLAISIATNTIDCVVDWNFAKSVHVEVMRLVVGSAGLVVGSAGLVVGVGGGTRSVGGKR